MRTLNVRSGACAIDTKHCQLKACSQQVEPVPFHAPFYGRGPGPAGRGGRPGAAGHYVEVHPERFRGFVTLATHPWVEAVSAAVLGPDYKIVEVGFDVPLPGAALPPWHRDFPAPEATLVGRRLNSLAFNVTAVNVVPAMGPFEIAPGTQWDDPAEFEHGMFPPKHLYLRYEARAQQKMPRAGDIPARSALTIHRGTPTARGRRGRCSCWGWTPRAPATPSGTTCSSLAATTRHCPPGSSAT